MSGIRKSEDKTLARQRTIWMKQLIAEYELIKAKRHDKYKFVQEFYGANKIKRQNFIKYYHRYKHSQAGHDLLPRKRGPRYQTKIPDAIEFKIIDSRKKGLNRYEIFDFIKVGFRARLLRHRRYTT